MIEFDLAAVDTETTGTDTDIDRVVEVGVVRQGRDGTRSTQRWLCNPGVPIPASATLVHGITDAMVASAPTFEAQACEIADALTDVVIVGHNIRKFDLPILAAEFARCCAPAPWTDGAIIDTLNMDRKLRSHDLASVVRHYLAREHVGAHGAVQDASASLDVLVAMLDRHPELPRDARELDSYGSGRQDDYATECGRIRLVDGTLVMGFGQHKGKPIASVQKSFLQWMLKKDFPADVKAIVRAEMNRGRA